MLTLVVAMQVVALVAVYGLAAVILQSESQLAWNLESKTANRFWRVVSAIESVPIVFVSHLRYFNPLPESLRFLKAGNSS